MSPALLVVGAWAALLVAVSARAIALARARRALVPELGMATSLLVLRPCCGAEPALSACLASAGSALPRGAVRVRHLVADASDPAWPVARDEAATLRAGGVNAVALVTCAHGPNRKADQLARGVSGAGGFDVLVCADSDVRLDAAVVAELLAAVSRPGVGAAWAPPVEVASPAASGDRASQAVLAGSLHAFALLAGLDGGGLVGKLFAVRREALMAVGGFAPLTHVLGEDVELGRRLRAAGFAVVATAHPAASLASGRSFGATVSRYARWLQVVRGQRPALLATYPLLFFGTPLVALASVLVALGGHDLALVAGAAALAARLAVAAAARRASRTRATPGVVLVDALLADVVLGAAFVLALASRRVRWRGRSLELRRGGLASV